ncbi:MAG: protein kinase [Thermosynechococcaceae cyanobacterium]
MSLQIGDYRLVRPLTDISGERTTEVFDAQDQKGNISIYKALKINLPPYFNLYEREVTALSRLRHKNIPRVWITDIFVLKLPNGKQHFAFVMEKIQGETLEQYVEGKQIASAEALDCLEQIVDILQFVHEEGYIHRDLKPSNIMRRPDGSLALIDFGGIRSMKTDTYLIKVSSNTCTKLVSYGYSAPEQWNGKVLPQSDFYALGRTMKSLLTGKHGASLPNEKNSGNRSWRGMCTHLNKRLADLIDQMTAVAPGDRPSNTQELQALILRLRDRKRWPTPKAWMIPVALLFPLAIYFGYFVSSNFRASFYYSRALQQIEDGDLRGAQEDLKDSSNIKPAFRTYERLAVVCNDLGDNPCAIDALEQTIQHYPNRWEGYFNLADLYDKIGRSKEAERYYQQAIEASDTQLLVAYNNLARLKILQKDFETAFSLIKTALAEPSDLSMEASLKKNLGWALYLNGDYLAADQALQQSIALDSTNAAAYCLQAQTKEALGKSAKAAWKQCLALDSDLPEVKKWKERYIEELQK